MVHAEDRSCTTQFELGELFRRDEQAKDYRESAHWFLCAARKGYAQAQYKIGVMYGRGIGVKQDDIKAYAWLKIAAVQGSKQAGSYLRKIAERLSDADGLRARWLTHHYYRVYVSPFH